MAKSKSLSKKQEQTVAAPVTTKVAARSPYQLDSAKVELAAKALVSHMKKHAERRDDKAAVKNLADDEDEAQVNDQPIFLSITTRKQMNNTKSLKPNKIALPHPIIAEDVRVCLFTKDPQRAYKDLVASDAFPANLRQKVIRVLGVDKLKKRYKSFEQKRALLAEFDVFMVDDRIIKIVAEFLGKTFYRSKAKRPIPVRLTAGAFIDRNAKKDKKEPHNVVGTPQGVAKEIETALNSTYLSMSESANTLIRVGTLSMTPRKLIENTSAVVSVVTDKHIEQGWRNVRGLFLKGTSTKALPIWDVEELWGDEKEIQDKPHEAKSISSGKTADRKRKWEEWEEEMLDDEDYAAKKAKRDAAKEKKAAKKGISRDKRKALKDSALEGVQVPLIAG